MITCDFLMAENQKIGDYMINLQKSYGEGSQGNCYECINVKTNQEFIVKILHPQDNDLSIYQETEFLINSKLKQLQNPNLVQIIETFQVETKQNNYYLIIMEKCQKNLKQYVDQRKKEKKKLILTDIITIIQNIINGYMALIELNILHRDLKPENILFGQDSLFKIADFGLSKIVTSDDKTLIHTSVGTLNYCSPQILNREYYTNKSDVFSLGIIIWEIIFDQKLNYYFQPFDQRIIKKALKSINPQSIQLEGSLENKKFFIAFFKVTLACRENGRICWNKLYSWLYGEEQKKLLKTDPVIEVNLMETVNQEENQKEDNNINQIEELSKKMSNIILNNTISNTQQRNINNDSIKQNQNESSNCISNQYNNPTNIENQVTTNILNNNSKIYPIEQKQEQNIQLFQNQVKSFNLSGNIQIKNQSQTLIQPQEIQQQNNSVTQFQDDNLNKSLIGDFSKKPQSEVNSTSQKFPQTIQQNIYLNQNDTKSENKIKPTNITIQNNNQIQQLANNNFQELQQSQVKQKSDLISKPPVKKKLIKKQQSKFFCYPLYKLIQILIGLNMLAENVELNLLIIQSMNLLDNNELEFNKLQLLLILYKKSIIINGNGVFYKQIQDNSESIFQKVNRNDLDHLIQDYQQINQQDYKEQKQYLKKTLNDLNLQLSDYENKNYNLTANQANEFQQLANTLNFQQIGKKIFETIQSSQQFKNIFREFEKQLQLSDQIIFLAMILKMADFQFPYDSFENYDQLQILQQTEDTQILLDYLKIYFN